MIDIWRHNRAVGNVLVFGLVGVFLVLLLTAVARTGEIVSSIRGTQQTNTGVVRDTHNTAELIKSCVEPTGRCFKRGQRATAGAVANINRVVILAAACAVDLPPDISVIHRQSQIQQCVIDGLAREGRGG